MAYLSSRLDGELLEAYRAQSADAIIEVVAHHRTATPETFALHDAQFVLARYYGFDSWPKLKAAVHVDHYTNLLAAGQNELETESLALLHPSRPVRRHSSGPLRRRTGHVLRSSSDRVESRR